MSVHTAAAAAVTTALTNAATLLRQRGLCRGCVHDAANHIDVIGAIQAAIFDGLTVAELPRHSLIPDTPANAVYWEAIHAAQLIGQARTGCSSLAEVNDRYCPDTEAGAVLLEQAASRYTATHPAVA